MAVAIDFLFLIQIKVNQMSTQTKIDSAADFLQDADSTVTSSNQDVDSADEEYFERITAEQAHLASAENVKGALLLLAAELSVAQENYSWLKD